MDVLEAQRVWQANHIHIQAGQTTSQHETTRKKPKQTNFHVLNKEVVKNEKEGKQREKKRKREQEDRRSNTTRSHYVSKPECMKKAERKHQKTVWNGEL